MRKNRRPLLILLLALCLIALFSDRSPRTPLYDQPLDVRSIPAVESALAAEGIDYSLTDGRIAVAPQSLDQARMTLLKRGLPEFCPAATSSTPEPATLWDERILACRQMESFLLQFPGVKDCRVHYGCGNCHYYWPDNHTCQRVFARILVDQDFELSETARLGLVALLAHSVKDVEVVRFAVTTSNENKEYHDYSYSVDLRNISDRLYLDNYEYNEWSAH